MKNKKIVSLLLSVCMILGMLPTAVFAEDAQETDVLVSFETFQNELHYSVLEQGDQTEETWKAEGKRQADEIIQGFPTALATLKEGSDSPCEVSVTWESVGTALSSTCIAGEYVYQAQLCDGLLLASEAEAPTIHVIIEETSTASYAEDRMLMANSLLENPTLDILDGSITLNMDSSWNLQYQQGNGSLTTYTGTLTVKESSSLSSSNTISVVYGSHTVKLDGVSIDVSGTKDKAAVSVADDFATLNLILSGTSTVKSGENKAGIDVGEAGKLNITSVDGDNNTTGTLNTTGGLYGAGIGCGYGMSGKYPIIMNGKININGGTINAYGGEYGAGIGGGRSREDTVCSGGYVTIYGGKVTAIGGYCGAGIGGGGSTTQTEKATGGNANNIKIIDGTVNAQGGVRGAGIGGGSAYNSDATDVVKGGHTSSIEIIGGTVEARGGKQGGAGIGGGAYGTGSAKISGGTVTANGGSCGAGIGGGCGASGGASISSGTVTATGNNGGAGIGGGLNGNGGTVTISDGTVTATGGDAGAGIGGGGDGGNGGTVTISGGTVTANGGSSAAGIGKGYFKTPTSTSNGSAVIAPAFGYKASAWGNDVNLFMDSTERTDISSNTNAKIKVEITPLPHTPVTDITNVPSTAVIDTELTLTGTVNPSDASDQTIIWSIKDTGNTNASIENGVFKADWIGTVIITATIENGTYWGQSYTQDFAITVKEPQTISVDITWGNMNFVYYDAQQTWNTQTHTWDTDGAGHWGVDENSSNAIQIANHSSCDISAKLKFEPDKTNIGGEFTDTQKKLTYDSTDKSYSLSMVKDTAYSVSFLPTGKLTEADTVLSQIGTITITIDEITDD